MENKYLLEDEFLRGANSKQQEQQQQQQKHHFEGLMFASMVGSAALVMAMLLFRRVLLISILNQWRFLAINLLFLAIISLTSTMRNNNANCQGKKASCDRDRISADELYSNDSHECCEEMVVEEKEVEGIGEMSKEELNRRAEAFIAMFRKQLVSDAMSTHSRFVSQRVGFVN